MRRKLHPIVGVIIGCSVLLGTAVHAGAGGTDSTDQPQTPLTKKDVYVESLQKLYKFGFPGSNDVIRRSFGKSDLEQYKSLIAAGDPRVPAWAVRIIFALEPTEESLELLEKYIRKPHAARASGALLERIGVLSYVAYLPVEIGGPFLVNLLNAANAEEFMHEWRYQDLPEPLSFSDLRYGVRFQAAKGLASYNAPWAREQLVAYYKSIENADSGTENYRLYCTYAENFAFSDLVEEVGLDEAITRCSQSREAKRIAIGDKIKRYRMEMKN